MLGAMSESSTRVTGRRASLTTCNVASICSASLCSQYARSRSRETPSMLHESSHPLSPHQKGDGAPGWRSDPSCRRCSRRRRGRGRRRRETCWPRRRRRGVRCGMRFTSSRNASNSSRDHAARLRRHAQHLVVPVNVLVQEFLQLQMLRAHLVAHARRAASRAGAHRRSTRARRRRCAPAWCGSGPPPRN